MISYQEPHKHKGEQSEKREVAYVDSFLKIGDESNRRRGVRDGKVDRRRELAGRHGPALLAHDLGDSVDVEVIRGKGEHASLSLAE